MSELALEKVRLHKQSLKKILEKGRGMPHNIHDYYMSCMVEKELEADLETSKIKVKKKVSKSSSNK